MNYRECFQYIDDMLHRVSGLSEEKQRHFEQIMEQIQNRAQNPYLHVALIGDFSTGKSTFINAMLGQNLLKTAWQATTAVPTLIYIHDDPDVRILVETSDGGRYMLDQPPHRAYLQQKLQAEIPMDPQAAIVFLSAANEFAGRIKRILVHTPGFEGLRRICVIDTPGVNPGDEKAENHAERTCHVLRNDADATIILFQSEQVYTASFQRFLKEYAGQFMEDAIFIVTMMDLVDKNERQEVINFVGKQLRQSFKLEEPRVFSCCAKAALSNKADDESKFWAQSFYALREEIIRYIGKNRDRLIERQIAALLSQILQELDAEVAASMAAIARRKQALERRSPVNLKRDLDDAYRHFRREVRRLSKNVQAKKEYGRMFDSIFSQAVSNISACTKFYGTGRDSITGYMESFFPDDVRAAQAELSDRIAQKLAVIQKAQEQYYERCKILFLIYQTGPPETNPSRANAGNLHLEQVRIRGAMDSAAGGIANFFGQFGSLERQKEAVITSVRETLERARAANQSVFYESLTKNGERILSEAKDIENYFSAAYQKIYDEQQSLYLAESEKLRRLERSNLEVHRKLTTYLDELNQKGTTA